MENPCTVQKTIYSEKLNLPPTPLISKFPFPEAATTTDMCICLEIPCIYKHSLFNLVHVARENFFNGQLHPSFPLEASQCTEDQDSKVWQGLQNPTQLFNVLSSHLSLALCSSHTGLPSFPTSGPLLVVATLPGHSLPFLCPATLLQVFVYIPLPQRGILGFLL